jgi:hypothetical protein
MKKALLSFAILAMLATPVLADLLHTDIAAYDESVVFGGPLSPINLNYDNYTNPPSALTSLYNNGANIIADDITFGVAPGAGWLDSMGFSVANINGPSGLQTGTGAIYFWDNSGNPLYDVTGTYNGFSFNLPTFASPGLAAGTSSRLSFAAGALESLGFYLPASFRCGTQWLTTTWYGTAGDIVNLGVQTRGPIGVGTSADVMYDMTAGTEVSFGGNPLANMAFKFSTDFTPEPSTLVLLGFGAVALLRRR